MHQTIGNMIPLFEFNKLTEKDPWDSVLAAIMFAVQTTVHIMLRASPTQLVFGRDTILNIWFEADWKLIQRCKEALIKKDSEHKNAK